MDKPKIIKNAPPPPDRHQRHIWPFSDMQPGDAFDAPMLKRANLAFAASQRKRRNGEVYTIRKLDDETVRVWRLS